MESERGHCVPPTLTAAKVHPEEVNVSGFGPNRKRLLGPKLEQEDSDQEDGQRLSHPGKRAKISTGEFYFSPPHVSISLALCASV